MAVAAGAQIDLAHAGEFDSVVEQVADDLPQTVGVSMQCVRQTLRQLGEDLKSFRLRCRGLQMHATVDEVRDADGFLTDFKLAGLEFGEVQDFVDKFGQCVCALLNHVSLFSLFGVQARSFEQAVSVGSCVFSIGHGDSLRS